MEKFKAVEKAMKTKAYSKEGLSAATKLDPKEKAKVDTSGFLSQMVDELEQQIEALEAESEQIQATMKKGKSHAAKAERVSQIEEAIERHKWHQSRLELMRRSLENGRLEVDDIRNLEESIRYYVTDNMNDDFVDDEEMYDELGLDEDEEAYGMTQDKDNVSSQDTQSIQEDTIEQENIGPKGKNRGGADSTRRPSAQLKSPLPTLATLATPLPTISSSAASGNPMKPASIPTRPAEGLKYASAAAAAAAATDKIGIAPLPPPPGATPNSSTGISPLPSMTAVQIRSSATNSPIPIHAQPTVANAAIATTATSSPRLSEKLPSTTATPILQPKTIATTSTPQVVSTKLRGKAAVPPDPLEASRRASYCAPLCRFHPLIPIVCHMC